VFFNLSNFTLQSFGESGFAIFRGFADINAVLTVAVDIL
jgi:hypothetical protein